jgi:hypothetical protein
MSILEPRAHAPTNLDLAYDAWKEADAAYRAAQARLLEECRRSADDGTHPSVPLLHKVEELRRGAEDRLRYAIDVAGVGLGRTGPTARGVSDPPGR